MPARTSRMIGRDAELAVLRDALDAGRAGHPRVVVVRGEAGIGKTRLLQEFRAAASALGGTPPITFAVGQCVDMGEIGSPFTPIRRLLRELYATVGDDVFRAAAQTPTVVATLAALLPELTTDATPADTGADYITESIERVIESLSQDHHLVVIIEDLHWADAATLALLKTLAVTLRGAHVTIVMTYRSDDVGRGHPLRPVLAELDRNRTVTGLDIGRLSPAETVELARAVAGAADTGAIDTIVKRSDGIPFFVEELAELDANEALPDTLRDLVLARFERLSDTGREATGLVAAGGVRVEGSLLETVHDGDREALRAGLREALAAHVLETSGEGYAFRHALIQEAVHDDLLPSERAELHARYAAALQRQVDAGHAEVAAEAAEHWLAARDLPRAFDAMVIARRHADSTWAPITAARLGERLVELWDRVPDAAARTGLSRAQLYADTAAAWRLQDSARAMRLARAGLAVTPADDVLGRAQLYAEIASAHGNAGRISEMITAVDSALDLLDDTAPAHALLRARALGLKVTGAASAVGGEDERQRIAAAALHAAELSGDAVALATCLMHLTWPLIDRGHLDEALAYIARIAALDLPADRRLHATISELDTLVRAGRFDEAVERATAAIALAMEVGLDRSMGALLASNRAEALLARGDAVEGEAVARRCLDMLAGVPTFRSFSLRLIALAASWDDRADEAEEIRRRESADIAAVQAEDPEEKIGWAEFDTEVALNRAEGHADDAVRAALVDAAVTAALVLDDEDFLQGPGTSRRLLPGAVRALAEADLLGLDVDRRERLRTTVTAAVASQPDDAPGRAFAALWAAESARGGAAPIGPWRQAVTMADERLIPVRFLHYARYRLAESLIASGDRDEAGALLTCIVADAPSDGAAVTARWARELSVRAGLTILGTQGTHGSDAGGAGVAAGIATLTRRERQVLALVAEGLTNPQIGQRLFISPKTASVHVSAILTKIGATNRAEAAALYAAEDDAVPAE
ncbi:helix-turn-helix transcriptional regulator [Microbacterium invictum]|uniref:DNA-binding CsgD family transcriptional regulator n=1 Tax=Microbacterium invictum TaxID=515415 RepID=A0AA40VMK1_9MICO|nr:MULTISPECIES: AAA family ATPase [Microbacterium]MBB4139922.1 DNA-binding CsgD family transcriptional regulator [Microbacterium invictum]